MRSGGVVALKLIVDLGRGAQGLLQVVGPDQRRWPVHLVDLLDLLRNVDKLGGAVQLLLGKLGAEDGGQIVHPQGLEGGGVKHGVGLLRHGRAQVEPTLRHLVFGEVQAVRDLGHVHALLQVWFCGRGHEFFLQGRHEKTPSSQRFSGTKA